MIHHSNDRGLQDLVWWTDRCTNHNSIYHAPLHAVQSITTNTD